MAVVPCSESGDLTGNVEITWDCLYTSEALTIKYSGTCVTSVNWVKSSTSTYTAEGTFSYKFKTTTTSNGKTCVDNETAEGSMMTPGGQLILIVDPAAQASLGYSYMASGFTMADGTQLLGCEGATKPIGLMISWLPQVKGFPDSDGLYKGEIINPWSTGMATSGTEKVKWSFSLTPLH
jgi:hypothetical protein